MQVHLLLRHHASSQATAAVMKRLMAGGVAADTMDSEGVPMICRVAAGANVPAVAMLLQAGAAAGAADTHGSTPLHYVAAGSIQQVEAVRSHLLPRANGAQPRSAPKRTRSSAPMPALNTQAHLVRASAPGRLAQRSRPSGAHVSLFQALQELAAAYSEVIELLAVRRLAASRCRPAALRCARCWLTRPHADWCCLCGHSAVALQAAGAPVSAQDNMGNTPVHEAARGAKMDLMKLLVSKGADLTITNAAGETPLHLAARYRSIQTVSCLVELGAPVRPCMQHPGAAHACRPPPAPARHVCTCWHCGGRRPLRVLPLQRLRR
jgi:Ankyrin repeats (3 copies)